MIELSAVACALVFSQTQPYHASEPNTFPTTGNAPPRELKWLDEQSKALMQRWDIPGGAVAVVKDGRLLFARGYGYADVERQRPVMADKSLFRIASVSKPITAAAVLKLEEEGKLHLEDKALDLLNVAPPTARADHRLASITVRDLLNMTAGWDKERSGDPILQPYIRRAAHRMHVSAPADFDTTMRYMLTRRLDFPPGARFAYSNFTYGVLGKIVERVSGQDYESFVRQDIFQPCGVQLYRAHTLAQDRLPNEVVYYAPLEPDARPFLPCRKRRVPAPYARAYMETDLPMIGWVSTAPELALLFDKLFGDDKLLPPPIKQQIYTRPDVTSWHNKPKYFSMGWEVTEQKDGQYCFYKDGTLPGTRAFVERTADGVTWVALFNARPPQKKPDKFAQQVKALMVEGLDQLPGRSTASKQRERRMQSNAAVPALINTIKKYLTQRPA